MDAPRVTLVKQATVQQIDGRLTVAYNVTFNVGVHGPFTIQIPGERFSADELLKRVNEFAAELEKIPVVEA